MPRLVEDGARGVGTVEGVEVDSGDVVVQEVVALFQGEVDTDPADQFRAGWGRSPSRLSPPNYAQSVDALVADIDAS